MAQQTIAIHPTLSRIRERGYWRTIIRPAQFEPERIGQSAHIRGKRLGSDNECSVGLSESDSEYEPDSDAAGLADRCERL